MLDATFSRLVGQIYDAVVDPSQWTDAIDGIRREFNFQIAMMGVMKLPSHELAISVSCNVPPQYEADIYRYGKDIETL